MDHQDLQDLRDFAAAIRSLRPGVHFNHTGTDTGSIEWLAEGVEPVTQKQVDDELARLRNDRAKPPEPSLPERVAALETQVQSISTKL